MESYPPPEPLRTPQQVCPAAQSSFPSHSAATSAEQNCPDEGAPESNKDRGSRTGGAWSRDSCDPPSRISVGPADRSSVAQAMPIVPPTTTSAATRSDACQMYCICF